MKHKTNETIRVLGGFYFTLGYIFDQLQNIFQQPQTDIFLEQPISCFDVLSAILDIAFIILFFACISKKRKVVFLQKFITNFPKISVYLYYIGFIGYILWAIELFVMLPVLFIPDETIQKFLIYSVAIINVIGTVTAFILASRKVFLKNISNSE